MPSLIVFLSALPLLADGYTWDVVEFTGNVYHCTVKRHLPVSNDDEGYRNTDCESKDPAKARSYTEECSWVGPGGAPVCELWWNE